MSGLHAIAPIQPIREAVYEQLKKAILSGIYSVGERLREHDLAAKLQVSRTPVREALRRLEAEGLLEALPRHGLVVKNYTDDDIREIYMIREALESLAAEFSAINATKKDITLLERLISEMDALDDITEAESSYEVHKNFSESYNHASHMPTLIRLIDSLRDQVSRFRNVSLSSAERRKRAREEHRELLKALKERDPKRASELTRIHISHALSAYFDSKDTAEATGVPTPVSRKKV